MTPMLHHLLIAPIVLPLVAASIMLLMGERWRRVKIGINLASILGLLALTWYLLQQLDQGHFGQDGTAVAVYLLGNWPSWLGIVLAVDRLSLVMVLLSSALGLAVLVYSVARWDRAGAHFHPMLQFLLMGLNGAFLTGDLFNLFVFFELLLAASYGLILHGSGSMRIRAGLHYITVNLAASSLFLIGVSLMYSVTGTLNMADMAAGVGSLASQERMLFEAGAAVLGVAFLVKAAVWPLNFWLPSAYAAACPPVAAMFVIMTKVGVYSILRVWTLLFGPEAGESMLFGADWLLYGGMATIVFGAIGILSSQDLARMAGFSVLVSSGTLLAAVGFAEGQVTGAALFYLVVSTLSVAAFFMLIELVERGRTPAAAMLALTLEAFGAANPDSVDGPEVEVVGVAIPAAMAFLGLSFVFCALLMAGLPPLSGFIAKFALLSAVLNPLGLQENSQALATGGTAQWIMLGLLIASGLFVVISMTRSGIRIFWAPQGRVVPRLRLMEAAPVGGLLAVCIVLTFYSGPVMRYMDDAARSLYAPQEYIQAVQTAPLVVRSEGGQP